MKKKEFQNIRSKPAEEIGKLLKEEKEKLKNMKFDLAAGKVKNIREIRRLKKTVAQLITLLSLNPPTGGKI